MSKYMRIILEMEVEVTDVTAAAAFTMDWGRTEGGEIAMMPYASDAEQIAAAVNQLVYARLAETDPSTVGFRWLSGSSMTREPEGTEYPALTIPAMPARREDGTYPGHF